MRLFKNQRTAFLVSIIALILSSGFIGYLVGNRNFKITQSGPKIVNTNLGRPKDVDFSLFWDAYDNLKEKYVGKVDDQKLLYGAIEGAFGSLGDPYTVFFDPEVSKDFNKELSGELEGIGIKIGVMNNMPTVISPLADSPAQKAGLKARDVILKVDDQDTTKMTEEEVVGKIRGAQGTTVKLVIFREGEEKERTFEIRREKLQINSVELSFKNDAALLTINQFGFDTTKDFMKAVDQIKQKGIDKIILDLRGNPGGVLDSAVDIAGEFMEKDKVVVIEEDKNKKTEHKTSGKGTLKQSKVVVLINGGSASAAEILAAAIRDNDRGKLIGEKTFGKGTVQSYEALRGGSSVKITIANWLTPKGANINKDGVNPDIEIKESDTANFDKNDPLLERGLEELK